MNKKFRQIINEIIEEKKINMKGIADLTDIPYTRIVNIKRDKAQATEFDLIKLDRVFPELNILEKDKEERETVNERLEKLEKENEEFRKMEKIVMRILDNQNKILSKKD